MEEKKNNINNKIIICNKCKAINKGTKKCHNCGNDLTNIIMKGENTSNNNKIIYADDYKTTENCSQCGKEISREEYINNGGCCKKK